MSRLVLSPGGQLESAVNQQFDDVQPGFGSTDGTPVLITPVVVPAASAAVLASTVCLGC